MIAWQPAPSLGPQRWLPATALPPRPSSPFPSPLSWHRYLSCWEYSYTYIFHTFAWTVSAASTARSRVISSNTMEAFETGCQIALQKVLPTSSSSKQCVCLSLPNVRAVNACLRALKGAPRSCAFNSLEPIRGILLRFFFFSRRDLCLPSSCGFWQQWSFFFSQIRLKSK